MMISAVTRFTNLSNAVKLLLIAIFAGLDHFIKRVAMETMVYAEPIKINTFTDLYLIFNKGAAFSLLGTQGGWQLHLFMTVVALACLAIFSSLMIVREPGRVFSYAAIFLISGSLGNLLDRYLHGFVVDYLRFNWHGEYSPVFNLADCYLVAGIILLLLTLIGWIFHSKSNISVNSVTRGF